MAETELRLGLPGDHVEVVRKRGFNETTLDLNLYPNPNPNPNPNPPPAKAQVVGWPPVRSCRKKMMEKQKKTAVRKLGEESSGGAGFVKVSMDGAPYLRKVDLRMYNTYQELSDALANMFSSFTNIINGPGSCTFNHFMNQQTNLMLNNSHYVPTYEDKDEDWMLLGDVPWEMFVESCKRLRIMKGKEALYLAPRAMEVKE